MRPRSGWWAASIMVSMLVLAACGGGSEGNDTTAASTTTVPEAAATTTVHETTVVTIPDPVSAWPLDGSGDPSVGDSVVEFSGAFELAEEAVSFDGYTGNGVTSEPVPVDTTQSFTVAVWVNYPAMSEIANAVSGLGEQTAIFGLGVGEANYQFYMKTEDRTGLEYAGLAEGPPKTVTPGWTHLVGVHDAESGMLRLHFNGELAGEAEFTTPLRAEGALVIGRGQFDGNPGNFWPGAVGDVAIYDVALTADQIEVLYHGTRPAAGPPARPAPDPSSYANGILDGTWDYITNEEEAAFILENYAGLVDSADEVIIRMGFDGYEWWEGKVFDGVLLLVDGVPEGSRGTLHIEDDRLIQAGAEGQVTFQWVLDDDQLTLTVLEECTSSSGGLTCTDDRSQMDQSMILVTEHTYTRSSDDPSY